MTDEFLSHLRSLNVELWSDGERLRCNAPQSVLTPELWAELKSRKQEVLVYLREAGATVNSRAPALRPVPEAAIYRSHSRSSGCGFSINLRRTARFKHHQSGAYRWPAQHRRFAEYVAGDR